MMSIVYHNGMIYYTNSEPEKTNHFLATSFKSGRGSGGSRKKLKANGWFLGTLAPARVGVWSITTNPNAYTEV